MQEYNTIGYRGQYAYVFFIIQNCILLQWRKMMLNIKETEMNLILFSIHYKLQVLQLNKTISYHRLVRLRLI